MNDNYNLKEMSEHYKAIYKRGLFFIETGSSNSFLKFIRHMTEPVFKRKYNLVVTRIVNFINVGDIDNAKLLWEKICTEVDSSKLSKFLVYILIMWFLVITIMSVYSFFKVL